MYLSEIDAVMGNTNWLDMQLEAGPDEIETPRGLERIERLYETVSRAFDGIARARDRVFVIAEHWGAGARVHFARHVNFLPSHLDSSVDDVFLYFLEVSKDGIAGGLLLQLPLANVISIGLLAEPVLASIDPLNMDWHEGECVVAEFIVEPSLALPNTPVHGRVRKQPNYEYIFETPDHDYDDVPRADARTRIPYIGIASLTQCPVVRTH